MGTNKKSKVAAAKQELEAEVKKLRARLASAEKSAGKWKTRAKAHGKSLAGLKGEVTAVRRKLEKAEGNVAKWRGRAKAQPAAAVPPEPAATPTPAPTPTGRATGPDDSWTVTRLRAEARARGVVGYSRKTKAQLIADLQRPD